MIVSRETTIIDYHGPFDQGFRTKTQNVFQKFFFINLAFAMTTNNFCKWCFFFVVTSSFKVVTLLNDFFVSLQKPWMNEQRKPMNFNRIFYHWIENFHKPGRFKTWAKYGMSTRLKRKLLKHSASGIEWRENLSNDVCSKYGFAGSFSSYNKQNSSSTSASWLKRIQSWTLFKAMENARSQRKEQTICFSIC